MSEKRRDGITENHIKTSIGGQALMEGIMMRGPKMTAMAVRDPEGNIVLEEFPTVGTKRAKLFRLPLVRGLFNFVDSMRLGYKCLMRSAEIAGLEDEPSAGKASDEQPKEELTQEAEKTVEPETEAAETAMPQEQLTVENPVDGEKVSSENADLPAATEPAAEENAASAPKEEKKDDSAVMTLIMVISTVLAVGLALLLFVWLPAKIYEWLPDSVFNPENRYFKSVFEGVCKVILLVGYMAAVSLMKDIRRTFMYHGAEHKTIFCYEAGMELTVENVRKMKRFHPRCGTSFLILMVLVSIFVGFFIPPAWNTVLRVLIKICLVPVIVGIGYELIKFAGRHDNILTKIISAPGMWLQHITVLEPDDGMIECAIAAVKRVIPDDGSDRW